MLASLSYRSFPLFSANKEDSLYPKVEITISPSKTRQWKLILPEIDKEAIINFQAVSIVVFKLDILEFLTTSLCQMS